MNQIYLLCIEKKRSYEIQLYLLNWMKKREEGWFMKYQETKNFSSQGHREIFWRNLFERNEFEQVFNLI
jgi:hypothetical protein